MSNKNSVIFYNDQIEICKKHMTAEQFGRLMMALFEVDAGNEPEVDPDIAIAYEFIALQMRIDREKYERICERNRQNGKNGGAPKGNQNAKTTQDNPKQPKTTQNKPNDNDNDNDNEKENDNENENESRNRDGSLADAVLSSLIFYLNQKTGGRHKPNEKLRERIGVLLDAGYTEADMMSVIDKKVDEWSDVPKMRAYLRPSTLFGDKFERYAAEPVSVQEEKRIHKGEEVAELQQERDDRVEELRDVEEKMELIRGKPDGIRGDPDGYGALKERKIVIEQRLEAIDRRLERMT